MHELDLFVNIYSDVVDKGQIERQVYQKRIINKFIQTSYTRLETLKVISWIYVNYLIMISCIMID